jgi:hypothetical protein
LSDLCLEICTQGLELDMELWTEYEGRTIDGIFPLAKLLQPEGRSAFFLTPNGTGEQTVIRLIESHFDDEEILARWRGVASLNHPNLAGLKKFGKVELDGTPLVYAVMEPAQGNLGEIVAERRLTVPETREVAESLMSALDALHSHGFVHEHVEPGSVLAVGDGIKLRSDCIRETPEDEEGAELRRRDVRDLAMVLLRALTGQKTLENAVLSAPFDRIVAKGVSGEWGLAEMRAALAESGPATQALPVAEARPVAAERPVVAASSTVARRDREVEESGGFAAGMGTGFKILLGLSVLVLLVIAWRMFHAKPVAAPTAVPTVSTSAPAADVAAKPSAALNAAGSVAARSAATTPSASVTKDAATPAASGPVHVEWRVIAFTYNHEDQAQTKASRLAGRHPELKPEVFSPYGRAPYLVSVGGAMSRQDAYALADKVRGSVLPEDTYAQNFKVTAAQ